jgi:hypothetical protein
MAWSVLVPSFFAGLFLANAVPHFVAGVMGKPFQTPFAKPRGIGLSSSTVNVLWAFFNLVVGYALLRHAGGFPWNDTASAIALALGALLISLFTARHFGALHGGNLPDRS